MPNLPMPGASLPGDISDVDRVISTAPITPGEEKGPIGQPFSSFMKEAQGTTMLSSGKTPMISPFDLPSHGAPLATGAPNLNTVMTQVKNAQGTLGDLSTHLSTPGLKLKSSTKYVLKNKMTDANTHFRAANAKLGAAVSNEPEEKEFSGPLGKFFSYIQDGQRQLESAQDQIKKMKDSSQTLSPSDFLLIQIKMNKAQQEIEYSSVLLSNAVSAFKQLMQIQL